MSHSIQCGHCEAILKSSAPVPPGKKIKCPKCAQVFLVRATEITSKPKPAVKIVDDEDVPEMDEEEDEKPVKKKRRVDDEPRSGRGRREEDDEDSVDVPKRKRKKKKAGSPLLLILLLGGGALGLFACVGFGIGVYLVFLSGPSIVGNWESTNLPFGGKLTARFDRDGAGQIDGKAATVDFKYTLTRGDPMKLEWEVTKIEQKQMPFGIKMPLPFVVGTREQFRVHLQDDTMTLTPQNVMGGIPLNLRRVKQ